jgi:hypothetical protein
MNRDITAYYITTKIINNTMMFLYRDATMNITYSWFTLSQNPPLKKPEILGTRAATNELRTKPKPILQIIPRHPCKIANKNCIHLAY